MPVPTIFLIDDNKKIVEMKDQPYGSEELLQELLAQFPSVLAGDQMSGQVPLKWLLVSREVGVPDEEGAADRWSLDHVFIDQSGVPTLVEVKRSTDTRIRREVVGQMLDYAANAVLYWPVETIRQRFEETCQEAGSEPDLVVADFIGVAGLSDAEAKIARFWETVETNLRAGKIRLIFAADEIPPELRRVVEFLNEQMNPAEVLAIEIRQYVGTGVRTLVPSVIRSSKRATAMSSTRTAVQWDRESFMSALRERQGPEAATIAAAILEWTATHCPTIWWGEGRKDGSCFVGISHEGVNYYPLAIWTYGRIQFQFQVLQQRGVPPALVETLATALNQILGIQIPHDALNRFPSFEISSLKDREVLARFLQAIEGFVEQIRTTPKASSAAVSS
jgi:hypothetical protein